MTKSPIIYLLIRSNTETVYLFDGHVSYNMILQYEHFDVSTGLCILFSQLVDACWTAGLVIAGYTAHIHICMYICMYLRKDVWERGLSREMTRRLCLRVCSSDWTLKCACWVFNGGLIGSKVEWIWKWCKMVWRGR